MDPIFLTAVRKRNCLPYLWYHSFTVQSWHVSPTPRPVSWSTTINNQDTLFAFDLLFINIYSVSHSRKFMWPMCHLRLMESWVRQTCPKWTKTILPAGNICLFKSQFYHKSRKKVSTMLVWKESHKLLGSLLNTQENSCFFSNSWNSSKLHCKHIVHVYSHYASSQLPLLLSLFHSCKQPDRENINFQSRCFLVNLSVPFPCIFNSMYIQ